ncbi:RNA polymerase II-associated protein 1, partial [Phenoliferia sp. Uapishka_3]
MSRIRPSLADLSSDYDQDAFPDIQNERQGSPPAVLVSRAKPPRILSTSTAPSQSASIRTPSATKTKPKSRFALEREQQQREREAASRFELNLDDIDHGVPPGTFLSSLVRDVVERESGVAAPPSFEQQTERPRGATGFPSSDQLPPSQASFKPPPPRHAGPSEQPSSDSWGEVPSLLDSVSKENEGVLASMSEAQILEEQRSIRESMGLSRGVLKMLEERARKKATPRPSQQQQPPRRRPDPATTSNHPPGIPKTLIIVEDDEEGSPEYIRKHFFPDEPRNANLDWMRTGPPEIPGRPVPTFDLNGAPIASSSRSADLASKSEHHGSSSSSFTLASLASLTASAVSSQRSTALLVLHRIISNESATKALGGKVSLERLRIECAVVAGRAIRDTNIGVVAQALSLLAFLFTSEPRQIKEPPLQKLEGAEETPTVLASFLSNDPFPPLAAQLSLGTLPRPSLLSILSIITSTLQISAFNFSPVTSLLLSTPNLLEALSRRFIAVPWPPSPSSPPPCPSAIAFLTLLSKSSRKAAKHLWEKKLVEPSLRFLAVLPWELGPASPLVPSAKELVLETIALWDSMGRYGLGTGLRTQGANLIDALLRGSAGEEADIAEAVLRLLAVWTTAAIDPHITGHDIIWSHVQEWGEVAVGLHSSLLENDLKGKTGLLASTWALLAEWMEGSKVNKSWRGEQERKWLHERLGKDFAPGGKAFAIVTEAFHQLSVPNAKTSEAKLERKAGLVVSALRLSSAYEETSTPPTPALLSLTPADVESALAALVAVTNPSPCVRNLLISLLPLVSSASKKLNHTLDVLVLLGAGEEVAARDLSAWVLAFAADRKNNVSLSSPLLPPFDLEFATNSKKLQHFVTYAIVNSSRGRVVGPLFPAVRDLKLTASQRPFASSERILTANWPMSVLDELLRSATSPAFEKLPTGWDGSELDLVRAALATMRIVQASHTTRAKVKAPVIIYDLIKVFMLEKDNLTSATPGAETDLFRDTRVQLLMAGLIEPLTLGRRSPQVVRTAKRLPESTLEGVSSLVSSAPFYQLFTDLVGLYDSTALSHTLFAQVILPPLSMDYPIDYRKLLWIDYGHLLRTIQVDVSDAATDHETNDDDGALASFLYPTETDPSVLLAYGDALVSDKVTRTTTPFLYLIAIHHVAAHLFSHPESKGATISGLAKAIAKKGSAELLKDLAGYHQASAEGEMLAFPPGSPFVVPGYEPGPDGEPKSPDERRAILYQIKQMRLISAGMESPVAKATMSGVVGFGLGAVISVMNSAMVFEDPYRAAQHAGLTGMQKNKLFFKDLGKGAWKSGYGFGKVGALYAGSECVIEGYRARNDIWNSIYAGAFSGAFLGRKSGIKAMLLGGAGFAAFSAVIDTYIRWDTVDEDA